MQYLQMYQLLLKKKLLIANRIYLITNRRSLRKN